MLKDLRFFLYQEFGCPHDEWDYFVDAHGNPYTACHQCGNAWYGKRLKGFMRRQRRKNQRKERQFARLLQQVRKQS